MATREWVELRRQEWGEGSPAWQSRVLGEFPDSAEDALIPLSLVQEAEARRHVKRGELRLGVDTARFGTDETVFVLRDDAGVVLVEGHRKWRETEIAGRIKRFVEDDGVEPEMVYVDNTGGYGAGAVDILLEDGIEVNAVNFGGKPIDEEQFANMRAEMYWRLMQAVRDEEFSLANAGPALGGQLSALRKTYDSKGRIKMEDKDAVRKRVGRSPDHADALALTFAPSAPPKPEPRAVLL